MVHWFPRSAWTKSKPACVTPFGDVAGVAIHYPGGEIPSAVAAGDRSATAAYLDQTRASQMGSTEYDYCDIEYSFAVDRGGNVWTLRGFDVRTGANGTTDANGRFVAVFVIVGLKQNAAPTDAQVEGIRDVVKETRSRFKGANQIRGHREFVATACPGTPLWTMVNDGTLEPRSAHRAARKARHAVRAVIAKVKARLARLRARAKKLTNKIKGK